MASATEIKQVQLPNGTTKYDLIAKNGIFYIEGAGTTDTTNKVATWTGTHSDITEYYNGLTVAYKISTAGSTTTTLNINNLGAVTVVRNVTTGVSTAYAVNSLILLTYTVDGSTAYWKIADYDANTKTSSGSSEKTATKLFLVGATSQNSSGVTTYSNKLCYIGTDNCLYSNGSKVSTSDADTGATSVEVTGSGNAVTAASYDASTRKLTLTKDATYNNYTLPTAKYNTLGGVKPAYTSTNAATLTTAAATNTTTPTIAAKTTTAGRYYAVEGDKNGILFVNVPWTAYSAATASALGLVKIGSNINNSSGTISVPDATTSTVGVAKLHKAENCTSYSSDDGGATPAAVKKAVSLFGIPRDSSTKYTPEDIILINSSQANQGSQPKIYWKTIGENTPFIGFATDQSDGTFVLGSLKGTNYASGLAIGGGSGNLLWKGTKVATVSDIVTYSAITNAQIDAICNASISNLSEVNF